MRQWLIEEAIDVVRALQTNVRQFGYHIALGGGVLNRGYSDKDIDLYFLPMGGFSSNENREPDKLLAFLQNLWGVYKNLVKVYTEESKFEDPLVRLLSYKPRPIGDTEQVSADIYKHAVMFTRNGTDRIDCFIF